MSRAVLSLGSNLGDRLGFLKLALDAVRPALVAVSSVYETKAWGVEDQPDFLNAICVVDDPARDHWAWLRTGQAAEQAAGRVRELRWGPRTLDVDVVTVDGVTSDDPELLLPHPGTAGPRERAGAVGRDRAGRGAAGPRPDRRPARGPAGGRGRDRPPDGSRTRAEPVNPWRPTDRRAAARGSGQPRRASTMNRTAGCAVGTGGQPLMIASSCQ